MLSQVWRYECRSGKHTVFSTWKRTQRPVWLHFQLHTITAYLLTVSLNSLYILSYPACTSVKGSVFQPMCYKKILLHSTSPGRKICLLLLLTQPAFHSVLVKVKREKLQTQLNALAYIELWIEFMSCSTSYGLMNVQLWSGYHCSESQLLEFIYSDINVTKCKINVTKKLTFDTFYILWMC